MIKKQTKFVSAKAFLTSSSMAMTLGKNMTNSS